MAKSGNWNKDHIVIPYVKLHESLKNLWRKCGIQIHFKGGRILNNMSLAPQDKNTITQKSGVVYRIASCIVDFIMIPVEKLLEHL